MKSITKLICISLLIGASTITGCQEQGPMQKAGENIDNAAKKTAEVATEVADDVKEAVK
jgi:predicted small secreted protein